jgi:molecular chaperone Hsp33
MISVPFNDPVLEARLSSMHPDGMSVFLLGGGQLRGAFFHGTRFVSRMRAQHRLGLLETMVLGQASLCGALLIPTMKGRDRAVFRYDTQGPAAGFSVEANSEGYVRGFLLQDPIPLQKPLESWDLAPFFGPGLVSVIRFPEGVREPVTGSVEIKHRNIARDLTEYFLVSEQTETAFNTGIQFDHEGRLAGAGGLYLQVMPGADPELVEAASRAFAAAPSLGQWFAEGGDREDIIFGLFRGMEPAVVLERDIIFDCPCSRENFAQHLKNLGRDELQDMVSDGKDPVEIVCHNCSSVYQFTLGEISSFIEG